MTVKQLAFIFVSQMKISSLILGAFLTAQTFTLHIHAHHEQSSYLSYLKGQQSGVTQDLDDIHTDIADTKSKVQNQSDIDEKIRLLEQAILRQKVSLSSASKSLITPLNESNWVCQNLNGTTDDELRSLAGNIVTSTAKLDDEINELNNDDVPNLEELEQDSGMAKTYGQEIQKALKTPGTYVAGLPTSYHTDFSVPNWISGGMTSQQINDQIDDLQGNIVTCPTETPFFNGHNCIKCPSNSPYFNIKTRECQNCQNFNGELHTCLSDYNGINLDTGDDRMILPPGVTIDDVKKQQGDNTCPSDRPFFANGNCFNCNSPNTLFNYGTKQCVSCPDGQTYIAQKYDCISKSVPVSNLAAGKDRMILPQGKTIEQLQDQIDQIAQNQAISECPAQKPFYNGSQCIECPSNEYFSVQQSKCVKCADGKMFDIYTHSCQVVSFYSNLGQERWASTDPQSVIQKNKEASEIDGAKKCPLETPFFDGNNCIKCDDKQSFFSYDAMKCSTCSSDTIFNYNMHSCVKPNSNYQTNPQTAPNLIYGGKPKNEWITKYDNNIQTYPQIADCPEKTPYFDGINCISCPEYYPYFNLEFQKCQKCQEDTKYDADVHQCLTTEGNIINQVPNIQKMAAGIFA